MCASPLALLRAGPPPPKVVLLPDTAFFTRVVPVGAGLAAAEAATQIELALEGMAPFPLAQLYYGWFRPDGAEQALVFAAYRRRFTAEQTAEWADAQAVLPAFAAVLGAKTAPGTTILLAAPGSLTAVHWTAPGVPAQVTVRAVAPEASDEERAAGRAELIRGLGGSVQVIDLAAAPAAQPVRGDGELAFKAEGFDSQLPAAIAAALDVRDKAELAALRAARRRDVLLWRITLGCAAALGLLLLGEFALVGGKAWQKVRLGQYDAQKALVEKITGLHEHSSKIDDLVTKRLLPIEMVNLLDEKRPGEVQFTRVQADQARGLYAIVVEGTTSNAAQLNVYEAALKAQTAAIDRVENSIQIRGERATFVMTVTFKPEALKPADSAAKPPA